VPATPISRIANFGTREAGNKSVFAHIKAELIRTIGRNKALTPAELTENRYTRFRKQGHLQAAPLQAAT
jgi:acetyl-CoA carboxylase alpha subunit